MVAIFAPTLTSHMISYNFVGNILVRLLIVAGVFYAIRIGPMYGLLALLGAVSLLTERSHQILTSFPNQQAKLPIGAGQEGVPQQLPFDTPEGETIHYESPHEEDGKAVLETHGENHVKEVLYEESSDIQDSNPRVPSIQEGEAAASFYEQKGLA